LSDVGSAALDEGFAFPLAGLSRDGSQASQRRRLFVFQAPEFAHIGDQLVGGDGSESLDADDDVAHAACSVGIVQSGSLLAQAQELRARGHAERLIPMVEEVLHDAGNPSIQRIVTTLGPGSYTGLRVALAAARAFGLAWQCPVLGVSSLAVLAFAVRDERDILVLQDAGRGMVYAQHFAADTSALDQPQTIAPDRAIELARIASRFTGGGLSAVQSAELGFLKIGMSDFPNALTMAAMADAGLARTNLTPLYAGGTYEAIWTPTA
jgi:tRNA threonylcarbamoyladenosine biosynthesis protein TsaB